MRGISRHVVRFVAYGSDVYAVKELPGHLAPHEYRLLRTLDERNVPVVEAVGVASGRQGHDGEPLDDVLITKHLEYSLPYRALFSRTATPSILVELWHPLLDALAQLLVRVHLAGFFWGDCSLSNTLFRRDAGALAAWLVDAETGELRDRLSTGQRTEDLEIAEMNVAGELLDIVASRRAEGTDAFADLPFDPEEVTRELRRRYDGLWHELTRMEVIQADEEWRVDERIRRLNELGFDVDELELVEDPDDETGHVLRLSTKVVEPDHHRRKLLSLTGLDVQENQARRLLNAILGYRAWLEARDGFAVSEGVGALRWMVERFEPTLAAVPAELRTKLADAEIYHQFLEHRWFLSEQAGREISVDEALASYLEGVLAALPDERTVFAPPTMEIPVTPG